MLALLAVLQVVAPAALPATPPAAPAFPAESVYSSPALRALVARASALNRTVPEGLHSYGARVESEIAIIARREDGVEQTFSVEQIENDVRWLRDSVYEQRVVGYRSQSVGLTVSAVGFFRQAWTVPMLYGNRIALFFGRTERSTARRDRGSDSPRRRPTLAVHPFADDRERVYRFTGGDTVVTLQVGGRDIPIIRVDVEPHARAVTTPTVVFRGEVDLDATRAHIVRMRGYFLTMGRPRRLRHRILASQLEAVAYVELENGEFDQRYWLPTYQRFEAQAEFAVLGEQRSVFRVISRFRRHAVNSTPPVIAGRTRAAPTDTLGTDRTPTADVAGRAIGGQAAGLPADSLRLVPHRLTLAPADSIDAFSGWAREIGELTGAVHSDDFADVAPDSWRPTGAPLIRFRTPWLSDVYRYNRVEGAFTGAGIEVKLRDAAPGVIVRGTAGWAWAERTVRGRFTAERQRGRWWPSLRVGRSLDITNDFREPFDSGTALGALLFSADDYDYVDRRSAVLGLARVLGRGASGMLRLEAGVGSDRYSPARREEGPLFRSDTAFRPNRGIDPGRYAVTSATLEWRPDVNAAFMRPGVGALVRYERGDGEIDWQRAEVRLVARRMWGPLIVAARADGGMVISDRPPPQQLFEIGAAHNLPGYDYKEFAGDRAAVVRGLVMHPLPVWRAPLRLGRYVLPSPAPALSLGIQSGWTGASGPAALASLARLGRVGDDVLVAPGAGAGAPVSRPTDGVLTSVDVRLRFFGGAVSLGAGRPVDRGRSWRFVFGLAQIL